jgi:hypothetical protein
MADFEKLAEPVRDAIDYAATRFEGAASTGRTVVLQRTASMPSNDQALWSAIRNRTDATSFNRYNEFINRVLCTGADTSVAGYSSPSVATRKTDLDIRTTIHGVDAYHLLKLATQAFLVMECGVVISPPRNPQTGQPSAMNAEIPGEESRLGEAVTYQQVRDRLQTYLLDPNQRILPYLDRIVDALLGVDPTRRNEVLPYCDGVLRRRMTCPSLLELIWSYWHEEGMLVQTLNAISLRFQNRRSSQGRDPLARLEIDPLRPLNNLLWGFIQDEYNRLTVPRRTYEYNHHYGLSLYGRAVMNFAPADSRSKFLEAFHNLLYRAAVFFREDSDTTIVSDGFPLLNALKEVHLLLAEGAHNQFGDLPWTARVEMLTMEWLLARPEMREFLGGRAMVPYREPWMGTVDSMKRLQGWSDTTVTHFRDLGVFGEQILLSVRYGDWIDVNDQDQARNWARYWKPEIQNYLHAYFATTGVDLTTDVMNTRQAADRYLPPSVHLRNRLVAQRPQGQLSAAQPAGSLPAPEAKEYESISTSARRMMQYRQDD